MRLSVICRTCNLKINFSSSYRDRGVLSKEMGSEIKLTCKKCQSTHFYHVNEVVAEERRLLNLFLFVLMIAATIGLAYYLFVNYWEKSFYMVFILPMIAAMPSMIYTTYVKAESKKVHAFNSYKK